MIPVDADKPLVVFFVYEKFLGITNHICNMALNIGQENDIITIYDKTLEKSDKYLNKLRSTNIELIEVSSLESELSERFENRRVLFHCQGFTHLIIAQNLRRQVDRLLLTVHGFRESLWYGKLFALYAYIRFRKVVDEWHFLSRKSRKDFFWFRSIPGNSCVFPLGIESDFMKRSNKKISCNDIFGKRVDGIEQNTGIVYVADFNPGKRHLFLLRSLKKLLTGNTVLYLLGDGPLIKTAIVSAKKLGIQDNVVFIGRVDRDTVHYFVSNAKLAVVPSRSETFGWCLLEPYCTHTPIVTTNVGIAESLIDDFHNGFILEVNCKQGDFAKKVKLALEYIVDVDNSSARHLYDWKTTATLFSRCYESILNQSTD